VFTGDALARGVVFMLIVLALMLMIRAIRSVWQWLRSRALRDVARVSGAAAGLTAKASRTAADSFKEGFDRTR